MAANGTGGFSKAAYSRALKSYKGTSEIARAALSGKHITSITNGMTPSDRRDLNGLVKKGSLWAVKSSHVTYYVRPGTPVNVSF
jgi:predicted transcriptional regulator